MTATSVKAPQLRPDLQLLPQNACEHAVFCGALEAGETLTRVRAAAGFVTPGYKNAFAGSETQQLALRRPPATAGATPKRHAGYEPSSAEAVSAASIGMPSFSSSAVARC